MVGHTVENMDVAFSLRFKVFLQNTVLPGYRSRTDCYEVSLTTLGSSVWKQQLRLLVHSTCDWARIRFRSAPTVVVKGINTLVLPLCILRLCCAYAPGGKPQQYTWSFGPVYDKIVHWGQA